MRIELPQRYYVGIALIGIALLGAFTVVLVNYGLGTFDGGYKLVASFDTAGHGLDTSSPVKIRGVTVGRVDSIAAQPDGRAKVTVKMRPGSRIADTATATIEGISVFGPKYLRVEQGDHEVSGPFLRAGDQFSGTERLVEFTTVLQRAGTLLEAIDPDDLATIITTFSDSVAGLGPTFGRIIDNGVSLLDVGLRNLPNLQQFLGDVSLLTDAFVQQTPDLVTVINSVSAILPAVTSHRDQLQTILDRGSGIASKLDGYLAGRLDTFGEFVDSAAGLLRFLNDSIDDFPGLITLVNIAVRDIANAVHLEVASPSQPHELVGALYAPGCSVIMMNLLPSPLPQVPLPFECPKVLPEGDG